MKLIFCRKTFSKKPILKIVSMGNTGKLLKKNKTQKQQKTFYNKSCSEKTVSKIVSMGYTGNLPTNKIRKKTSKKNVFTKKCPKDRINGVYR